MHTVISRLAFAAAWEYQVKHITIRFSIIFPADSIDKEVDTKLHIVQKKAKSNPKTNMVDFDLSENI